MADAVAEAPKCVIEHRTNVRLADRVRTHGVARRRGESVSRQMNSSQIQFDDGLAYERYMGRWSQLVGEAFVEWLDPRPGLRWLDVGCGNGAFTEVFGERSAPLAVHGVDPSAAQVRHARGRPVSRIAHFSLGDAMALPFREKTFDVAVMPLVIFFVPEPDRGVAEMVRVVRRGGVVCAYAWDMLGGGLPYEVLLAELRALNVDVPTPPHPEASRREALSELWSGAGLRDVETTEITVQRSYADFEDYWTTVLGSPSAGPKLAALTAPQTELLRNRLRGRLVADADGRITCTGRSNAVKGSV